MLEAKIVLSDSIVISLGAEFMENEKENVSKQDCENAAAKRLLERLKQEYPRLKIFVLGDGLYGVEPVMKQCSGYGWKYIFGLPEGLQKNITKGYNDPKADMKHEMKGICTEGGTGRFYNGVEKLTEKKRSSMYLNMNMSKKRRMAKGT